MARTRLCCTIIGIPFGMAAFRIAGFAFFPFGKELVEPGGRRFSPLGKRVIPTGTATPMRRR